jgi:uncharacterized protein
MHDTLPLAIASLYIYPVKSCAGVRVDQLTFDQHGRIAGDREWAVVDAQSELVWQGSYPRLALVQPSVVQGVLTLHTTAGMPASALAEHAGASCQVKIWNEATAQHESFAAHDGGDDAAQLLSTVAGSSLRLVRLGPQAQQRPGANAVHMVSASSLAEFSAALVGHSGITATSESAGTEAAAIDTTTLERLRPNSIVTGLHEPLVPFIEEHFTQIHWQSGDHTASLSAFKPCVRCIVPNVNPATGVAADGPLETLGQFSAERHPGMPIYFGVYATPSGAAALHLDAAFSAAISL